MLESANISSPLSGPSLKMELSVSEPVPTCIDQPNLPEISTALAHTASVTIDAGPQLPTIPIRSRPSSVVGQRAVAAAEARGPRPLPSVSEVYTATYSSIPVWEMRVGSVDVMRRCRDNWLNATQMLKVACIDKPQRTKILEREIQTGLHEKVQGGYGKYQGTWVPFERGFEIAHQYGVDNIVGPLINFNPAVDPHPPVAPRRTHAGHAKNNRGTPSSTPATSPATIPRSLGGTKRPRRSAASTITNNDEGDNSDFDLSPSQPGKRGRRSTKASPITGQVYCDGTASGLARTAHSNNVKGNRPLPNEVQMTSNPTHYMHPLTFASKLLEWRDALIQGLLTREEAPMLIVNPPHDMPIDLALDDQGHTTLHWAAALARTDCIRLLLKTFNSVPRDNDGATPLMWAIRFDDNYAHRSFKDLLALVGEKGILATDLRDRTVLHHIGLVAGEEGKMPASEYYLTELVLRRGVPQDFLDVQDQEGNTALHLMVHEGHTRLADLLQSAGARTDLVNYAGHTPAAMVVKAQTSRGGRPPRRPRRRSCLLPETMDSFSPSEDESDEGGASGHMNVPQLSHPMNTTNAGTKPPTLNSSQQQAYTAYSLGKFHDSHALLDRILMHESALASTSAETSMYTDRLVHAWADILQAAKLSLFAAVAALRSSPSSLTNTMHEPGLGSVQELTSWSLPSPEMAMQTMSSRVLEVVGRDLPIAYQLKKVPSSSPLYEGDIDTKKLHQFRTLIAKCCAIPVDKVDDAVDGLLHALDADLDRHILNGNVDKPVGYPRLDRIEPGPIRAETSVGPVESGTQINVINEWAA